MKTSTLMIFATFLGAAAFAGAQDDSKKEGRPERSVPPELLEKFDKDKDGKLSREEWAAVRAEREKEFDKDGDGKLNEEERKAFREANRKRLLEKYDKDGDGKLSEEERKAIPAFERGPREGRGQRGQRGEKAE